MRFWNLADECAALFWSVVSQFDKRRLQSVRADYYEFLSALIDGTRGRFTLRDIFDQDAYRYSGSARGRLSSLWSRVYSETGGDLYATWIGCFPSNELSIIRVAQLAGNETLVRTLHDMAEALRLVQRSHHILRSTILAGVLSLCILIATILAVPMFTVPQLKQLFMVLPPEYLAIWTRRLFSFSHVVELFWAPLAAALVVLGAALLWSIPNFIGRFRQLLDRVSVWRIHRCVNALSFLSVLTVLLNRQGTSSTQLRTALVMLCSGASPWMHWHLQDMLGRIDHGLVGADTFDTGLLDRELYWHLHDMTEARGLIHALVLVRDRLDSHVLAHVARQAQVLRWGLLVCCVTGMLFLGLWHYAVIDELRRSLMIFYASQ